MVRKEPLLLELETRSPGETETLGTHLGRRLSQGDGLALVGELGAGKTLFARGVARGLGVEGAEEVSSPSYLLMVEYPGPVPFFHFDGYFAAKEESFLQEGGQVLLEGEGVALVEWADKLEAWIPPGFLWVRILSFPGLPEVRRIRFSGDPRRWRKVLEEVEEEFPGEL